MKQMTLSALAVLLVPALSLSAAVDDPCDLSFRRLAVRRFVLDNELTLGEYAPQKQTDAARPRAAFDANLAEVASWCPCAHYSVEVESGTARIVFALPDGSVRMEFRAEPGQAVSAVGATVKSNGERVPAPPFRLSLTCRGNAFSVLVTKDGKATYHGRAEKTVALDWRRKDVFGVAKFYVDTAAGRVTRAASALSAGYGQADVRFVTTGRREKRLYIENGRLFFTFSARGPNALGVASFDPARFDVRLEGTVLFDAGDGLYRGDHPADLFYDEEAKEWRAWVCNFSTAGLPNAAGGREKGGINCAWSKQSPLHGLTFMEERSMGLDGMNEDPTGFYDTAAGKWRVFLSEFTREGIRGSLWEADDWKGPYARLTPPTKEDSTGQCLVELGGRRWAIAGSADHACHVYEYPSLKLHGDIRFDNPPWSDACPNSRVWGTLAVLPDGFPMKYLFLTMDRVNFPGVPTPNWTYGALYLYGAEEPVADASVPIPRPADCRVSPAATVAFDAGTTVVLDCPDAAAAAWLGRHFADWYGALAPKVASGASALALPDGDEAYAVRADAGGVRIRARTLAGTRWAAYTLRQMAMAKRGTFKLEGRILPACEIADAPLLAFRGLHLCWIPEVRAAQIERAIRLAALFKYNYVVLEPWGMYRSERHPWWGWPDGKMTKAELKRLVALGRDLGVTLVPQINCFGHATLARSVSLKHAILDLHPEYEPLFEPGGWNWCLSNPETRRVLCELIDEMHDDFGRPPYFHLGCDEAQAPSCPACRQGSYAARVVAHIASLADHVRTRGARAMIWHDMFISANAPGREHTVACERSDLEMRVDRLPKDLVICDWQYSDYRGADRDLNAFPSVDFFADRGFSVVAAPWENAGTEAFHAAHVARRGGLGVLQTTWHHLRGQNGRDMLVGGASAGWGTPFVKPIPRFDSTFATALRLVGHDMRVAHPEDTGVYDQQMPPSWWPAD